MMRRICIIPMSYGSGYESLSIRGISNFEECLRKYGGDYEVFYFKKSNARQVISNNAYNVTPIKRLPKNINIPIYITKLIWYIISNPKFDLYIADDVTFLGAVISFFGKLLKKKTMVTIHGFYEDEWNINRKKYKSIKNLISRFLSNFTLKNVDLIVINDDRMKEMLLKKGVPEQKIWKRYVFGDTDMFDRNKIEKENLKFFIQKHKLPASYVLFVGYLTYSEGITDALKVFKNVNKVFPEVKYVVLGHGELENELQKFIQKNPHISITFIRHIDFMQMPMIYFNALVVLLPAHPPQAGIGRIVLEAISMKCPVITTDVAIFNKVVIDTFTGFIVREGDIDTMSKKLIELLRNEEMRKKMGKYGRDLVVKHYSLNQYMQNWIESLEHLFKRIENSEKPTDPTAELSTKNGKEGKLAPVRRKKQQK
jgi:glycosyltransferase involved in cell wall biosynthesis